jgi:hypothetical protein
MTTISRANRLRLSVMALRVKGVNTGLSVWREFVLIVKQT